MASTRVELRQAVREQLDVDDEELPNQRLDLYLDDAYEQTLAMNDRWPFLETSWTIGFIAGERSKTLPADLDQLASVIDLETGASMVALSHDQAEVSYPNDSGGVPATWSEWRDRIYLWPFPSEDRLVQLRGYRKGNWGPQIDAVVDADSRLHTPIIWYACALAYASQEDEVLEMAYMNRWNAAVMRAHAKIMAAPARRPLILSGASARRIGGGFGL